MNTNNLARAVFFLAAMPIILTAQARRAPDPVVLKPWAAPLYFLPQAETAATSLPVSANPLVFVAITPCRVVDTRASQDFPAAFGPPSLAAGMSRTFPIPSSACAIPAGAQAYSFNVTVVPAPGSSGFITAYPTGQSLPLTATLVWTQGSITSNAAIVQGGTNGSVNVYADSPTDIVIDMNGYYASLGITPSSANTALGSGALQNNTSGGQNTASGSAALQDNTSGSFNTANGTSALNSNTTGSGNTAVGFGALTDNTTGNLNSALGGMALGANTVGSNNTAIGNQSLMLNTTGNNDIAVGSSAANSVSGGNSNNIHIGSQGAPGDSSTIRIGTPGTQTSFFAAGIRGVTTGNNDAVPVVIDSGGQLGTVSSSRRFKEDIHDMGDAAAPSSASARSPSAIRSLSKMARNPSNTV